MIGNMCQPVSRSAGWRGSTNTSGYVPKNADEQVEVALAPSQVVGQLAQLHDAERGADLARLEVPADLVEDEEVVVLDAVDLGEEPPVALLRAEELRLRCAGPSGAAAAHRSISSSSSSSTMPPVRGGGDDVREREARDADVGARAGGRAAQRGAERSRTSPRSPSARGRRRSRGCGPSRGSCR